MEWSPGKDYEEKIKHSTIYYHSKEMTHLSIKLSKICVGSVCSTLQNTDERNLRRAQ